MKMDWIWLNGGMVREQEATVSVLAHALHYGSSFFEGIRAYETADGKSVVFRLREHLERLYESTKIYRTEIPYTIEELEQAICETLQKNNFKSAYIRPLVYRGKGQLGVEARACPVEVLVATWEMGAYLGEEGLEKGVTVQISSWNRPAPNTLPTLAKAGGNYLSSQLIKMEAVDNGYDEGIALDVSGNISEASAANIFVVKNNILYTPPTASSLLVGITRDTVIQLARKLGFELREQSIPREFLYTADEIFLTGTAAEITPVAEIDRIQIGSGARGVVTKQMQEVYADLVRGKLPEFSEWLYYVE